MKLLYDSYSTLKTPLSRYIGFCAAALMLLLTTETTQAQSITGKVFRDFNADGVQSTSATSTSFTEPGVKGIIVKAFDTSGVQSASATSGTDGSYTLATTGAGPFRIEFSNLTAGDYDAFRGSSSGTSVQFAAGGTTVNYGVNYPAQYCERRDPPLVTTCFVSISNSNTIPLQNRPAMVGVPYTAVNTDAEKDYATFGELGATWGLAYNKDTKRIFSSAFTKRHIGFGAGGPNAIYVTNVSSTSSGNTTPFFNFTTVGGTAVSSTAETHGNDLPSPSTGSPTNTQLSSYDIPAFDAVGKTSLGDIDISDDNKTLYVVNLKDRKLYTIDVATKAATGFAITNPCGGQSYRPFAVKYYRGKVYVGVVCTREDVAVPAAYGPTTGLSATVYEFDGTTFTSVLSFPLTFKKQPTNADKDVTTETQARAEYWRPWTATYQTDRNENVVSYPQAWLTDIEFDVDGDMIVGLRDRFGDQIGYQNRKPIQGDQAFISAISPGSVMRARKCNPTDATWTLESNGALCGGTPSAQQDAQQGPGGGKYYWGDQVQNGGNHGSSSQAGLALLAGSGKLAMTAIDPIEAFNTGGIKRLINATGAKDGNATGTVSNPAAGKELYISDALGYGKANGLGDLEVLCAPSPIQIGNRVWKDTNNNGIQDPGEPPISGVSITLKGNGLPPTGATVTTNANGEYYFSSATGINATGFVYSLTGLTSGSSYSLTFPTSASAGALNLSTKPNSATGSNAGAIDTDPNAAGLVSFTLGQAGQNNFTYDAAYSEPCSLTLTPVAATTCNPATNQYAISGNISLTNASAGIATITDGAKSTTITVPDAATSVAYSLTGLLSGTGSHTVTVSLPGCGTATATYAAPASCSVVLTIVVATPVCNSLTNNYTATGTVSLTNATVGSLTITDNGSSIGVVSVTAGQTSASFSLTGVSGSLPPSHTVVAALGMATASTTYATPASCTVCSLSITATALANGQVGTAYSQTITTSGGTAPISFSLVSGSLPAGLSLNPATGVISGTPTSATTTSFIIEVTDSKNCILDPTLTITTAAAPVCSLTATATPGVCNSATNSYDVTGTVSATNTTANQSLTISADGVSTQVSLTGNGPVSYTLTGLSSDGLTKTVTVLSSATACRTASVTYAAPASCSVVPGQPKLEIEKFVNKSRAVQGDILSYTVVLTNTGTVSATNVTVSDVSTGGLNYVANSASAPAGTTFTQGTPTSTWQVPTLSAGQSLSLTFQAKADSSGILYNTARIPGDTVRVCTTIPVKVCAGDSYLFRLTAAPGRSSYKWFKDNVEIAGQTTNVLDVTAPGTYSLAVDNVTGSCPDFSCCPFIIEEDTLPTFQAMATPTTCVGSTPQSNGNITLSQFKAGYTYQYSLGTTFNEGASLSGAAQVIPAGGVIVSNLGSPATAQAYTVRVYNAAGCYTDVTVILTPTVCNCPVDVCVPLVIKQTKGVRR